MNPYASEEARIKLANKIAGESAVLLKNEAQCLPIKGGRVAFFGRACYKPNLGGMGSGASTKELKLPTITQECEKQGIFPASELHSFYQSTMEKEEDGGMFKELMDLAASGVDLVASGAIYEIFGRYHAQVEELRVSDELMLKARAETDTALIVLGRNTGGEECDRRIKNDYELLPGETELLDSVCKSFQKVVLLLNINGVIDVSWIFKYPNILAVLFMGTPGEQGPAAVAKLLAGRATPSGKLAFTIAGSYGAYPTAHNFSYDKDQPDSILEYKHYGLDAAANGSLGFAKSPVTLYSEGLYMGYRYFDSFGKDVIYPFGYGLSYAEFSVSDLKLEKQEGSISVSAVITNLSREYCGKETLQIYVSAPRGALEKPYQSYLGCEKTGLLAPGEKERVTVSFSASDMASYDEEQAAWILEPGTYYIRAGVSSRNTHIAGGLAVEETILCEQLSNALSIHEANRGKIDFLTTKGCSPITYSKEQEEMERAICIQLTNSDIRTNAVSPVVKTQPAEPVKSKLADVKNGVVTMDQFLSQMSIEELAVLANGYGSGLPFGGMGSEAVATIQYEDGTDIAMKTHKTGMMGYVSPALLKYGIPSACYKDGPASVGLTAWPTGMTMACSFNKDLFYAFGAATAYEAEQLEVDSWLAPAINLHRNPLGGRNYEYFSEDPVVTGICGLYICKGVAENSSVTACPKHFAINEQETYRRGSSRLSIDAADSIVSERTARELYLKPFEIIVKNCPITTIMTSFNKINGTLAGGNHDLCTKILRDEWGFKGVVVTDWGDMDIAVDGADAVAAGNDVIMPGGPPVIKQVLQGYREGRVSKEQLMEAAAHLLYFVMNSPSYEKWIEGIQV
ncbi:MAG TPA: beta-glucosidase [Clostridiales bacterium]|nr:beta-glucosidase [Clostridiales bacterium]